MKNLLKLLGIIALAAVIGFTMGCKQDEEEDEGGGDYKGLSWPPEFLWDTSALTSSKTGSYSVSGTNSNNINFSGEYYLEAEGKWTDASFNFSAQGSTPTRACYFNIASIDGKKITVKQYDTGTQVVLCTDWTVAGGNLTLTGGDADGFRAIVDDGVNKGTKDLTSVPAAVLGKELKQRK